MNRKLDESLVDCGEGNEIKREDLPQPFAKRNEICESRQDNKEEEGLPGAIHSTNRDETCKIRTDEETIRNEKPQSNKAIEEVVVYEEKTAVVDPHPIVPLSNPNERRASHVCRKTLHDLETKDKIDIKYSDTSGCRREALPKPNELRASCSSRKSVQDLETKKKMDIVLPGTPGSKRVGVSSSRREALSNPNERWASRSSRKSVQDLETKEKSDVVLPGTPASRRVGVSSSRREALSNPNERWASRSRRKSVQDLETKHKTDAEHSGTSGSRRVVFSSRREALSNPNERWASCSSRKSVQDLETKYKNDAEYSGISDCRRLVSFSRRYALSNPNERRASCSSRKRVRDLETKHNVGFENSGISDCQRVVSSSRREAVSNPNERWASRSSRKSAQDLETKEEINIDPGSVGVIEIDEEIGSEGDGRTILYRMGSASANSTEEDGRTILFQVIESDEEEGSVENGRTILYRMGSESANSTEEDGQTILYRMGSESEISTEEDGRTILYRMGSESISTVSSRVVTARVVTAGEEENQEGINQAVQSDRPKVSNVTRRLIMVGAILLSILIAAVGAGFAISYGESAGGDGVDQCDFTDIGQLMQCECIQKITKWSEDVYSRYQDLLSTIIPEVNPNFSEPATSCSPSNLALIWLAVDDFSSGTTDMVTLTNRYVLALLFQTWTGANWKTNDGWLSSQSECTWYGITCNESAITGIELGENSLQSSADDGLPTELFTLTSLSEF
jgi:hypothetical protein